MTKFGSSVRLPSSAPGTTLHAEIFWGCDSGESRCFPQDLPTILVRKASAAPRPINAFREAVMAAIERIWIMDGYFLSPGSGVNPETRIRDVLEWFHVGLAASDIRVLTNSHKEVTSEILAPLYARADVINKRQSRRGTLCTIQVNERLRSNFDHLHDRFAIVDNELWHFGATVGGFHTSVNAASRGWNAVDVGAIRFFELAWRICEGN